MKNTGIETLNPMQHAALESLNEEKDIILSAPTGSGKTLAFLGMLLGNMPATFSGTFAIIITPTRELALQITDVFQKMKTGYKVTTCYGGHKREIEENNLIESPALIIGTPGRLSDHIRRGNIHVAGVALLILDEFDKSLEMGFNEEIGFIVGSLPDVRRKILVSATPQMTLPGYLALTDILHLDFAHEQTPDIQLNKLTFDGWEDKPRVLLQALCTIGNRRTIIFVNQKETVRSVSDFLTEKGIYTVSYHGSLEQQDRETAITKFRNGTSLFLITTDLASRGLDISHVRYIIHFDMPETEQVFVHRNGRTARMEATGDAIIMVKRDLALPDFLPLDLREFPLVPNRPLPDRTECGTLYISAGKKDKINKVDIAGFLMRDAGLKREDTGLIEVKDFYSFAAVRRSKMNSLIAEGSERRIKNKKVKISSAK